MDFTNLLMLAGGGVLGAALGIMFGAMRGRQMLAGAVSRPAYDAVVQEKIALTTRLESAHEELGRLTEFHERALNAEAENRALTQRLKEQQEQLRLEFKTMANAIFEENSKKFSTQSEKKIGDLLTPMQQKLNDFKELVTKSFSEQGKEQHTLKSEIEKIVLQTDSLSKALRGDVKAQGNWGEVMLERILEESSLRKDVDYTLQGSDMNLSGADGNRLRPDVIVNLPDNKHIIIDAKVSLTSYERYCAGSDDIHLQDFLKSVKTHVNGLEQKRYQDIEKLGTPDFVLMFMPIEGAYALAMQQDRELHSYAWGKRIVIVCPTTLFATLQTIASLWKIERQNKNAQEIARQSGALYDKFVGFIEDMEAIDKQLGALHKNYDSAMNKLKTGRGNLIGSAEKLKLLGAKTTKSLGVTGIDELDAEPMELIAEN